MLMKKTLLTLLLTAGTLTNSLAGSPLELNNSLINSTNCELDVNREGKGEFNLKDIKTDKGYNIIVGATHFKYWDSKMPEKRSVYFIIDDTNTSICISDYKVSNQNTNFPAEWDTFSMNHRFNTGDNLHVNMKYEQGNNINVETCLYNSEQHRTYFDSSLNTQDLDPATHYLIMRKMKPVIKLGEQLYSDLVNSAVKGSNPDLPYTDVKGGLSEVEKILPNLKAGTADSDAALLKLSSTYIKLAKQKLEERKIRDPKVN